MRILIEEYQYSYDDVCNVLRGIDVLQDEDKKVSLNKVGYFFSPEVNDCVFILPKVLLEGNYQQEKVFGHINPRDLIYAENCKEVSSEEYTFIYNLSTWIYRAICVFKEHEYDRCGGKKNKPSIIQYKPAPVMGQSRNKKLNTFLDVLLALERWNRENQNFVTYIIKNLHSGFNKINWTRTISKSSVILQHSSLNFNQQSVVYLNPINKKRQINFDEELLIIYYSILQYIKDTYGFPLKININFPLIQGKKFESYLCGLGRSRLLKIKYKYFSDKSLELWNLCFAFFDRPNRINLNTSQSEYLLVKSFNVMFEAIIDDLIAGDQMLPKELLDQPDGKIVDHMFQYRELTNDDTNEDIYYIGDSKYYKRGNALDKTSVYKQFTYARNVIQWNIDLFNDDNRVIERKGHVKLRDDITEGYNVIPNFFISANQNVLHIEDDIKLIDSDKKEGEKKRKQYYLSRQFENRLFDRDTFLLAHYDVNFLFIVALYGRNNQMDKSIWRYKVRGMFRNEIQQMLKDNFIFYAITAHSDIDPESFIRQNFQSLLGKIYAPFDDRPENGQKYYSIALRNPEKEKDILACDRLRNENEETLQLLNQAFYIALCPLGTDPKKLPDDIMPIVYPKPRIEIPKRYLTVHYLENYPDASILVGGFNGWQQLNWIFSRQGGKRDDAYNVRLGKNEHGGVVQSREIIRHAKFVLLYEFGKEDEGIRFAFRVKNTGKLTKQQMLDTGYENPNHDAYFCYFFDEEISLGKFDVNRIIDFDKNRYKQEKGEDYPNGRPVFLRGNELIQFRKE